MNWLLSVHIPNGFLILLVWLSGALFLGGAWQLEIVNLRREHDEPYYLPFFLLRNKTQREYSFWGDVWMGVIGVSYILILIAFMFWSSPPSSFTGGLKI